MARPIAEDSWLTVSEVASLVRVDARTVERWIDEGELKVARQPGQGPRVRAAELIAYLEHHDTRLPSALLPACRWRVLVADDDRMYLRGFARALRPMAERIQLIAVDDGAAALAALQRYRPHLAIVDVLMPPSDGLEICRLMHAQADYDLFGVVLVSSAPYSELETAARKAGSLGFYPKPLEADLVLRLAQQAIARSLRPWMLQS